MVANSEKKVDFDEKCLNIAEEDIFTLVSSDELKTKSKIKYLLKLLSKFKNGNSYSIGAVAAICTLDLLLKSKIFDENIDPVYNFFHEFSEHIASNLDIIAKSVVGMGDKYDFYKLPCMLLAVGDRRYIYLSGSNKVFDTSEIDVIDPPSVLPFEVISYNITMLLISLMSRFSSDKKDNSEKSADIDDIEKKFNIRKIIDLSSG